MEAFKKNYSLQLTSLAQFISDVRAFISENPNKRFFVNITAKEKKRSLPANNTYYAWLPQISDTLGLLLPEARCYLKLTFGVPILFSGERSQDVQDLLDSLYRCGFFDWDYETQMKEMKVRPITSLMNTKQHNEMREQIQIYFGMQGLNLDYEK